MALHCACCVPASARSTFSDFATRYLLACDALATTKERYAFTVFERAFKDFGLPSAIRTDNGVPFASGHSLFGLSKLSVWWLRLGIRLERIKPGHPEQNGRHERMHLTLKQEATRPAGANILQQQGKFDDYWPKSYQAFLRFDEWDPNRSGKSVADKVWVRTLGLNIFFAETSRVQINHLHTINQLGGAAPTASKPESANGWTVQIGRAYV